MREDKVKELTDMLEEEWDIPRYKLEGIVRMVLEFCEGRKIGRQRVEPDINPHLEIYDEEPK